MKFTQKLNAYLTTEWRQQYIGYAELKYMILNVVEKAPFKEISNSGTMDSYYSQFEEDFFLECDKELRKINNFYAEKLSEATRRNELISKALEIVSGEFRSSKASRLVLHQRELKNEWKHKKIKLMDLKNGYSELYLSLVLLKNYKTLNYTGFKKILKKHDKLLNNSKGKKWLEENVSTAYFFKDNTLDGLMEEVENNFTEYLENGDRAQAMKCLRVPALEEIPPVGIAFRVGLFLGAFIVLMGFILILSFFGNLQQNSHSVNLHNLILFRAPFYVIMYIFLLGINVFSWRRAGVNHVLIFEINPREYLAFSHLLEIHGVFGLIWSLCVLGFFYADKINMSKLLPPLLLIAVMLAFVFNPLPMFYRNARCWLLKIMGRVVMAPLFNVGFADFWLGDQLNSMVACLLDLKYLLCFYIRNTGWSTDFPADQCLEKDYIGNAVVRCIPSWLRFAQCLRRYSDTGQAFPFLVNAGKYASTFPMVLFFTLAAKYKEDYEYEFQNPFLWYYLVSATLNSCYCCCYDTLRDFGLFKIFSGKNIFLREDIIYRPVFYYFAILENFVLRFVWAISLCLVTQNFVDVHNMDSIVGCLEMIRRYIWNYLRLENEHLFNVGQFRAVRDIFIAPMDDINSAIEIEKMMDEEDGVVNHVSNKSSSVSVTDANEVTNDD